MSALREALERPQHRIAIVIFCCLWFCTAYFAQGERGANTLSRIALAYSIVDGDGFVIDAYQHKTVDKSMSGGKYYSDKAPGLSFMAVPAVWVAKVALDLVQPGPESLKARIIPDGELGGHHALLTYFAVAFTTAPLSALAAAMLFLLAYRAAGNLGAALFATAAFGLGTIAWGFAASMLGHAPSGALLLLGFSAFWWIDHGPAGRFDALRGAVGGALLGWTVVTDFTAAPAAGAIALLALFRSFSWAGDRRMRVIGAAFAGGVIALLPLMLYNWAVFGAPLTVGYSQVVGFEGMDSGFFGLTAPTLERLCSITFGSYRGLFWFSPILLVVPFGLYRMWRSPGEGPYAGVILFVCVQFLVLNASYHYWDGHWSTGPRHLAPGIALACVPLAFLWAEAGPRLRNGLLGLLGLSIAIAFVSISTTMFAEHAAPNPLFNINLPMFFEGNIQSVLSLAHIRNHFCLAPPILVLAVGAVLVRRESMRKWNSDSHRGEAGLNGLR